MCGRCGRRADKQRIAEWIQKHDTNVFDIDESYLAPSYNVCPQSLQPAVRQDANTGERQLAVMRWGLVPHGPRTGKPYSTRSTRGPKVALRAAFREAFKRRRCLVLANFFYEMKLKQPYAIALRDNLLFAFASRRASSL